MHTKYCIVFYHIADIDNLQEHTRHQIKASLYISCTCQSLLNQLLTSSQTTLLYFRTRRVLSSLPPSGKRILPRRNVQCAVPSSKASAIKISLSSTSSKAMYAVYENIAPLLNNSPSHV